MVYLFPLISLNKLLFQTIPAEFFAGLGNVAEIILRCEADVFNVNVSRMNPHGHGVVNEYVLNPNNWNAFCEEKDLEYGDVVVFTKIREDLFNVMGFNADGSNRTDGHFLGVTRPNAVQPLIPHIDESKCVNLEQF